MASTSQNGLYVTIPCWNKAYGSTLAANGAKGVAVLRADATFDMSTMSNTQLYTASSSTIYVTHKQVVTVDGSAFWFSGRSNGGGGNRGWKYVVKGATTATAVLGSGSTAGTQDCRGVSIFNNQLYGSDSNLDVGNLGIFTIGTGLPTTTATNTLLPGITSAFSGIVPHTFVFQTINDIWCAIDVNTSNVVPLLGYA
jgi:hypothetical protein